MPVKPSSAGYRDGFKFPVSPRSGAALNTARKTFADLGVRSNGVRTPLKNTNHRDSRERPAIFSAVHTSPDADGNHPNRDGSAAVATAKTNSVEPQSEPFARRPASEVEGAE
jgi:lysophospholipase L1-like esterase